MSDPYRRVKIDNGSVACRLCKSICHANDNGFLKSHDVAKVIRKKPKHRELRRTGVAEKRRGTKRTKELKYGFPYGRRRLQGHRCSLLDRQLRKMAAYRTDFPRHPFH